MIFAIIIVAIVTVGRIVRMGMELDARKNGFSLKGKRGVADDRYALTAELEQDNAMLRGKIARLEDRMAVLERIATDAPARLSAQIDDLR
jgi:hypothetical protein